MEKHELSSNVASGITERSSEVSESINEVVVSLQFHDITSQQLIRIKEAIGKFAEVLEEEYGCKEGCLEEQMAKKIYEFSEIQIAHLSIVRDEFTSAVGAVKANLLQISSNISRMSEETRSFVDNIANNSRNFLSWIKQALSFVSSTSQEVTVKADVQRALTFTLNSFMGTTSDYMKEIEEIDGNIENMLHSPRTEKIRMDLESGMLYVLVDSIQQISAQATTFTNSVSTLLTSVSTFVDDISSGTGSDDEAVNGDVAKIQKELDDLINTLRVLNTDVRSLLLGIDNSAMILLEEIRSAAGRINIHITVKEIVNDVISNLENIAENSYHVMPSELKSSMPLMEKPERSLHGVQYDSVGREDDVNSSLGSNIELF
jgi:hypothetical protein